MKPFEQGLAGVSPVQQILHDLVVGPFRAEVGSMGSTGPHRAPHRRMLSKSAVMLVTVGVSKPE